MYANIFCDGYVSLILQFAIAEAIVNIHGSESD